jgi:WhiB family transcriptional regulator, redox-sensing transcriptional regulator
VVVPCAEGAARAHLLSREEDPELFFPIRCTGPALRQTEEAKAVCRRRPVRSECLTWALESGQDAGVWGGLGQDERRALRRRNARGRSPMARTLTSVQRNLNGLSSHLWILISTPR